MKQQKKKTQKIPSIKIHRINTFKDDHIKSIPHLQIKENLNVKSNTYQPSHKIIKRIGCKPIVNAYRIAITQAKNDINANTTSNCIIPKQNKQIPSQQQPSKKQEQPKKLKRIGKKIITNAYKQTITSEQTKQQQIYNQSFNNQYFNQISPLIKITFNNQSKQINQISNPNFQKIPTIKRKDEDETKIEDTSSFDKNTHPLQCPPQQYLFTQTVDQDSHNDKIQLLLSETQRKLQIKISTPHNYQQKQPNHINDNNHLLQVPNIKYHHQLKSNDSLSINSLGFTQDISSLYKSPSDVDKTISQMDKSAQSFNSSEEKIFQITQQALPKLKNIQLKQLSKSNSPSKNDQPKNKQQSQLQNGILHKKIIYQNISPTTEIGKYESGLQQIYQDKEDQNKSQSTVKYIKQSQLLSSIKKSTPKPANKRIRFSVELGPRKLFKSSKLLQSAQKMVKSFIKQQRSLHNPSKISDSQASQRKNSNTSSKQNLPTITNTILPLNTNNIAKKILKRQSLALRYGNNKQNKHQNNPHHIKISNAGKQPSRKLEVHKCVAEARKTLNYNSNQ